MTFKTKLLTSVGTMTAMERARGRYMRAPDHPNGDGGTGGGDGAGEGSGAGGDAGAGAEGEGNAAENDPRFSKFLDGSDDDPEGDGSGDDDGNEDEGSEGDGTGDDDGEQGNANGDDDGEGDGDGNAELDDDGNPKPKPPKVDPAVAADANARATAAQAEADKWRRIAEGAPALPEAVAEGEKDPNAEPDAADFEFGIADPEYIAAKAEWGALNRLRAEGENARIRAELNQLEANYQTGVPAALAKYPDFDEVVTKTSELPNTDPKFWPCPPMVAVAIRASKVGHDVAYHLAKDGGVEAKRIAQMTPFDQMREFGQLEGRYLRDAELAGEGKGSGGDQQGKPADPPRNRSKAPTPPKRQTRGVGGQFKVPADTSDFSAFKKQYDPARKKQ